MAAVRRNLDRTYPTLWFRADWTVSLSEPLVGGQPLLLRYDLGRQRSCRGANWVVLATIAAPGHTPTVLRLPGTDRTGTLERYVTAPLAGEVAIWFEGRDDSGCQVWDSDFGRNFRFTPRQPERVVHLLADYTTRVDGPLRAGLPFCVDFDLQRLPFCVSRTADGRFLGEATLHARFDGGTDSQVSLLGLLPGIPTDAAGYPGQLPIAPELTPPTGASTVEMWFHASDRYGCTLWDSSYGANYRFTISP